MYYGWRSGIKMGRLTTVVSNRERHRRFIKCGCRSCMIESTASLANADYMDLSFLSDLKVPFLESLLLLVYP